MAQITFKTALRVLCEWSGSSPRGNILLMAVNRFKHKIFFQVISRGYAGQIMYLQPVSLSQVAKLAPYNMPVLGMLVIFNSESKLCLKF